MQDFAGPNRNNIYIDFRNPIVSTSYADESDTTREQVYRLASGIMEANAIDTEINNEG
jgi:hypothetical protein